jgi:hypothetical protein
VLVLAVGPNSEWGRTMALVQGEAVDTPLQEKLGVLATAIGKLGLVVAVICFLVLLIRWVSVEREGWQWKGGREALSSAAAGAGEAPGCQGTRARLPTCRLPTRAHTHTLDTHSHPHPTETCSLTHTHIHRPLPLQVDC